MQNEQRENKFPVEVIDSISKTLPLNIHLNESFGKGVLETNTSTVETLRRLVPQANLILSELSETIGDDSLDNVMDGIGDMITTADGLFGFVSSEITIGDFIENNGGDIIHDMKWDVGTVAVNKAQTVDDLMLADYTFNSFAYSRAKQLLAIIDEPKIGEKLIDSDFMNLVLGYNNTSIEQMNYMLIGLALRIRYCSDMLARSLDMCPVKILEEVYSSNMSKLCTNINDAEATLEKYAKEGLTQLKISAQGDYFAIIVTEEVMFRNQLVPAGKFMKGVNYKKPDFSDKARFALDV